MGKMMFWHLSENTGRNLDQYTNMLYNAYLRSFKTLGMTRLRLAEARLRRARSGC